MITLAEESASHPTETVPGSAAAAWVLSPKRKVQNQETCSPSSASEFGSGPAAEPVLGPVMSSLTDVGPGVKGQAQPHRGKRGVEVDLRSDLSWAEMVREGSGDVWSSQTAEPQVSRRALMRMCLIDRQAAV